MINISLLKLNMLGLMFLPLLRVWADTPPPTQIPPRTHCLFSEYHFLPGGLPHNWLTKYIHVGKSTVRKEYFSDQNQQANFIYTEDNVPVTNIYY